ncbi:methyltransferase [Tardiphaga sp.]|uniref:tRNA1(Val) (adenine(37)-N6)-methyltransferase n=1 Tax=Tardiphaga sp. TaxID=1926292 RepID=UPI002628DF77|nr:methyltransferase [Tardiphaga sp.]MDB5618488.1 Methyltransferase [Tardiphaga sp.]
MAESLSIAGMDATDDAFLGGQLRLRQPASGHRAGHDAILLAAATSAQPGDRVVDFGAGVGTAGLALAWCVKGVALTLLEIDPQLAQLARGNAAANHIDANVISMDIASPADVFAAAGLPPDSVDVVLMNPPFNDAIRHRASPDKAREVAHVATSATLDNWTHAARRLLRSGGALTLIWRGDGLGEVLAALEKGFGSLKVLPVHGDPAKPAIRIIVRAVKGGRAPAAIYPGINLRDETGAPDPYIQQVLSGQAVLSF